jgi:clan AA aspartic protease
MMTGSVSGHRAMVPVTFRIQNQPDIQIEFVLDAGFNGFLTLPPGAVATLRLPFRYRIPVHLADGSSTAVTVHSAAILWHGTTRLVEIISLSMSRANTPEPDHASRFVSASRGGGAI